MTLDDLRCGHGEPGQRAPHRDDDATPGTRAHEAQRGHGRGGRADDRRAHLSDTSDRGFDQVIERDPQDSYQTRRYARIRKREPALDPTDKALLNPEAIGDLLLSQAAGAPGSDQTVPWTHADEYASAHTNMQGGMDSPCIPLGASPSDNLKGLETLAEIVQRLRGARGWTQGQLAKVAGITQGTVARIERGTTKIPDSQTIAGLARAFQVAREELDRCMGLTSEPAQPDPTTTNATLLESLVLQMASRDGFGVRANEKAQEVVRATRQHVMEGDPLESIALSILRAVQKEMARGASVTVPDVLARWAYDSARGRGVSSRVQTHDPVPESRPKGDELGVKREQKNAERLHQHLRGMPSAPGTPTEVHGTKESDLPKSPPTRRRR